MIPIKRHLPRSVRRVWDRCPSPPCPVGNVYIDEYGAPRQFCAWIGRHPRCMEWVLFAARRLKTGRVRVVHLEGLTFAELRQYVSEETIVKVIKAQQ